MFGRDDLLGWPTGGWTKPGRATGRLLLLAGEAGIGKTRLVGAIERPCLGMGFRAIRGRTSPRMPPSPRPRSSTSGEPWRAMEAFATVGAEVAARIERIERRPAR